MTASTNPPLCSCGHEWAYHLWAGMNPPSRGCYSEGCQCRGYSQAAYTTVHLPDERIAQAVAAERERCAKIAESFFGGTNAIGPLFGAGVSAAAKEIAAKIREGK